MNTIINILEGFEKLAYKFLLSILFIPKTIVQVTINPSWAPGYVAGELKQEKSPFDEYISPVILLLVVALIPAVVLNILPNLGTEITGAPVDGEAPNSRSFRFKANTISISGLSNIFNEYVWYVEKIEGFDDEGLIYTEIWNSREPHNEYENINHDIVFDNAFNISQDSYLYKFEEPGDYFVNVEVRKFDPDVNQDIEFYYSYVWVTVPFDEVEPISIEKENSTRNKNPDKVAAQGFSKQITDERTIFLALGLLSPPLLFAVAIKLFRKGEELSENSLKESFYTQCYYFSPISLAVWATYYAGYFLTPDVYFYWGEEITYPLIILPPILAVLWFIGVETRMIAQERQTKTWKAFLIVMLCVALTGWVGYIVYQYSQPFSQVPDKLRLFSILLYPLMSVLLLGGYWFTQLKRMRAAGEKITVTSSFGVLFQLAVVSLIMVVLYFAFLPSDILQGDSGDFVGEPPVPTIEVFAQPSSTSVQAQPTSASTQVSTPQPSSSASDFDPTLSNWEIYYPHEDDVTNVVYRVEGGSLILDLIQKDDKKPRIYFLNKSNPISDVQIGALVKNNGNNANRTSLICRFSDQGWYEFSVSNSGYYEINAYVLEDNILQRNLLFTGGSSGIATGLAVNSYIAVCNGNELSLFINDILVRSVVDTNFNFPDGKVGIAVSSPQGLPVSVSFDQVKISEP